MNSKIIPAQILDGKLPVWLRQHKGGIPLSSTVILHRNIKGVKFPHKASKQELKQVCCDVVKAANRLPGSEKLSYALTSELLPAVRGLIYERGICDSVLSDFERPMPLIVSNNGEVSIHVNNFDHVQISVTKPGLAIEEAMKSAKLIAKKLGLAYAEMSPFGALTTIPALMGTGLDTRVLVHLPALSLTDEMYDWTAYARANGVMTTGYFGPESPIYGDMYCLRNQNTHGQTEEGVIEVFRNVVTSIMQLESKVRKELDPTRRTDAVARAYGTLRYVYQITFGEAMNGLSLVKMGVELGLLKSIPKPVLSRLMCGIFPTQLQLKSGCPPDEIDTMRAAVIRNTLSAKPVRDDRTPSNG